MLAKNGENICAYDPKGENLARTGAYLKELGYYIITLDFRNVGKRGDFWNPLWLAYKKYKSGDVDKAQEMFTDFINVLAEPQRKNTKDIFWPESAASLAAGIILLLAECAKPDEMNIASFARLCCQDNMDRLEYLTDQIPEDSVAGMNLKGIKTSPEKTKQSIYISLFSMISIFLNQQNLVNALSDSTFDMEDIPKRKTAVYIITPDERTTYNFAVSLFVKQLYDILISAAQESPSLQLERRMNFILDEFCNIPKINDFPTMISAARSRNIRFFLVTQGLRQLYSKYGEEESQTIIGNCSNLVYLYSRKLPLLKMISELCGERYLSDGRTRPLMTTSQLQRLDKQKGEVLIFSGRLYPYVTQLPDIDEYEMFKNYPEMKSPSSQAKEAKILSLKKLIEEIECGIRPVPFTKQEESYVDKIKSKSGNSKMYDNLQDELERRFDELFGGDC
ncbi:MAG: type IV secretory system conjugative DNA transfer family protein [Oscillospiraceae bacterium]|nr:type IV secretory system conjugative DNA transfer family protein [Oscillospiraceae bacterium]